MFDHIKDLNYSEELDDAKKLLGYGHVRKIKVDKKVDAKVDVVAKVEYYATGELKFLTDPKKPINDPRLLKIKESLDSFIVFLVK